LKAKRKSMPQRSSINFWLLLAATICVDAVSMSLIYGGARHSAEALYVALVCGQLSALCAWASFSRQPLAQSLLAFGFAIAASWWAGLADLISNKNVGQTAMAYAGVWLVHVALLLVILWAIKRTPYGRHWGETASGGLWQFSLKQLLAIMTTFAILVTLLRRAQVIHDVWLWVILLLANNLAVALSGILIYSARWHVLAQIAVMAGLTALLGSILYLIRGWPEIIAVNLIHVFVLFAWLQVGEIIPKRDAAFVQPGSNQ
jgi:hypothetical protein